MASVETPGERRTLWRPLVRELVRRELHQRYLGSLSGGAWAIVQPLLQLAIYGYVFGRIFAARLPEQEFGALPFVAFLAIGLWPWNAFAEGLTRACTAIVDIPTEDLVPTNPDDFVCIPSGALPGSASGIFGASGPPAPPSYCSNTRWAVVANVADANTGAKMTLEQGVGVRVSKASALTNCP